MSDTPGWQRPADDHGSAQPPDDQAGHEPPTSSSDQPPEHQSGEPSGPPQTQPPYPGWSAQQPPRSGWTVPGQPPSAPTYPPPQQPTGDPRTGGPTTDPPTGWGSATSWGWQQSPTVRPGVIPLRPLGVGEILDGAVTTIRRHPGPMLGLSAVVAVLTQLLGFGLGMMFLQDVERLEALPSTATAEEVLSATAGTLSSSLVVAVVTWLATVVLTGILTVVVSRAVLGHGMGVSQAWAAAKGRIPRLLLLTVVYSLVWLSPFIVTTVVVLGLIVAGADTAAAGLGALLGLASVPFAIWLYVRFALSGPALMLETVPTQDGQGQPRRIGVVEALRRSGELVRRSWWRVFGILLLVWFIAVIVVNVINVPFAIPSAFVLDGTAGSADASVIGVLALSSLGGIIGTTITAPFTAAATALLYVDRRIRREGLDIELARAAGVSIPGRTDSSGAAPPPVSQ